MKKKTIFPLLIFVLYCITINAQSPKDSLAIEEACRNYVEGWATADINRIDRGVSPELVKRTVGKDI